MANPEKTAAVDELVTEFERSSAVVLTEYRGLTVRNVTELRRALGGSAKYAIVKNTLTRIAAQRAGVAGLDEHLAGPSAIAFVTGDVVEAAKGLREFARTHPALVIKAGVVEGRALTAAEVSRLADLESREVLLARLAGGMTASLSRAVALFQAPLAQTARVVEALRQQRAEGAPVDDAPPADEVAGEADATPTDTPAGTPSGTSSDTSSGTASDSDTGAGASAATEPAAST